MKKKQISKRKTILSPKLASMMRKGLDPRHMAKAGYK